MYQRLLVTGTVIDTPETVLAPQGYVLLTFPLRSSWAWQARQTKQVNQEDVTFTIVVLDPPSSLTIKEGDIVMVFGHLLPDAPKLFEGRGHLSKERPTILARHVEIHNNPKGTPLSDRVIDVPDLPL